MMDYTEFSYVEADIFRAIWAVRDYEETIERMYDAAYENEEPVDYEDIGYYEDKIDYEMYLFETQYIPQIESEIRTTVTYYSGEHKTDGWMVVKETHFWERGKQFPGAHFQKLHTGIPDREYATALRDAYNHKFRPDQRAKTNEMFWMNFEGVNEHLLLLPTMIY